jgi:pimeloyl-ACP methyl ester carboxylesterase
VALVLVHGGLGDYRSWEPQLPALSRRFHVLSYSRRYSYPNENQVIAHDHSVFAEAEDLAAFITRLQLSRVHLVGHSYGAFTALVLALKRPEMARTLVLAEPPVHRWIKDVPGGEELFEQIATRVWEPVRRAFECGDIERGVRIFTDGIGGPGYFDSLPAGARAARLQNARALQALMQSSDAFPALAREDVWCLAVPILIIEGEQTIRIHRLVDDEILRCVPGSERIVILHAGHDTPRDNPGAFNEAVLNFLSRNA